MHFLGDRGSDRLSLYLQRYISYKPGQNDYQRNDHFLNSYNGRKVTRECSSGTSVDVLWAVQSLM